MTTAVASPTEQKRDHFIPQLQRAGEAKNQPPVVLIVDDDPDFVDIQQAEFEAIGFDVLTAGSAAQAEDILQERRPDLAVVDLMMENSDAGFCLSHEMKCKYPEMPVMMVTSAGGITGVDFESLRGEARSWIPADVILSKPLRFEQIERELVRLLKGK
jgi:DNA-binding NtrC family response regulator